MAQRTNTDTGSPSGNKPAQGTGIPTQINDDNMSNDQQLTDAYTHDDEDLKEHVREMHPNRNTRKSSDDSNR